MTTGVSSEDRSKAFRSPFVLFALLCQAGLLIGFALYTDYDATFSLADNVGQDVRVASLYKFYSDVAIMIFIGFGYLMAFMKHYGYSAVGYTFFISVIVFQWAVLVNAFFEQVHEEEYQVHELAIDDLINGMFAAGAVMITFGGLLGKTTPFQLLVIAVFEVMVYAVNFYIGYFRLEAVDIGGSMFIHTFGAYFGLACSLVFSFRKVETKGHADNGARYNSDLFALIGTIWLWLMWPSFNAALAVQGAQFRAIINTVLSLCCSTAVTFIFSFGFRGGKFDMVDVQNATLAGGVAVGCAADLTIQPAGAMGIGLAAGLVSVFGFNFLSPLLERKIGLQDTCGIHNLHGMPGIIGGISGILAVIKTKDDEKLFDTFQYDEQFPHEDSQPAYQLAALAITLGLAIGGGIVAGFIARLAGRLEGSGGPEMPFRDAEFWTIPGKAGPHGSDDKPAGADIEMH